MNQADVALARPPLPLREALGMLAPFPMWFPRVIEWYWMYSVVDPMRGLQEESQSEKRQ